MDHNNTGELRKIRTQWMAIAFAALRSGDSVDFDKLLSDFVDGASGQSMLPILVARACAFEFRAARADVAGPSDLSELNESILALKGMRIETDRSRVSVLYGWLILGYAKLVANSGDHYAALANCFQAMQSVYRPEDEDRDEWYTECARNCFELGLIAQSQFFMKSVSQTIAQTWTAELHRMLALRINGLAPSQKRAPPSEQLVQFASHQARMNVGRLLDDSISEASHSGLITLANESSCADSAVLACLKIFALENKALVNQLPSVRSLRTKHFKLHQGSRRVPVAFKALEQIESLYDRRIKVSERVRLLGSSAEVSAAQLPIEARLLYFVAVGRFALRHGQQEMGNANIEMYHAMSNSLSENRSSDIFGLKLPLNLEEVKTESTNRLGDLAKLAGSTAFQVLSAKTRSILLARERQQEIQNHLWQKVGEDVFTIMSSYRGGMMKVGQVMSMLPNIPDRLRSILGVLRYEAQPTPFADISKAISQSLSASTLSELNVDPDYIAVGSIAQIHPAIFQNADVIVKVKHPNIEKSLKQDLRLLGLLGPLLKTILPSADIPGLFSELTARLLAETDFSFELATQENLRDACKLLPKCKVPKVYDESAGDVLIMERLIGRGFREFIDSASSDERNEAGATIAHFVFYALFKLGIFNGDPHPGNFIFLEGGKVGFIDFGFSKKFDDREIKLWRATFESTIGDDRSQFENASLQLGIVANPKKFNFDEHWQLSRNVFLPFISNQKFRFNREFVKEVVALHFSGANGRHVSPPPSGLVLYRIVFGLYGLLGELEAENNWKEIFFRAVA